MPDETLVLVLQGGGALGAYQAGAYAALHEAGYQPNWLAGISIGAINSAIIAGNPPDQRVRRLREFWHIVSSGLTARPPLPNRVARSAFNHASAALAACLGIPGFFRPRFPPAILCPPGSKEALSVYDTAPLRTTLESVIDFDVLNHNRIRLSVGTTNVRTGNFEYFDTARDVITPEHIMASAALPPGLPPIRINNELYWDGGLVSNTPLQYVLEQECRDMCIFQVDLFSAKGRVPKSLMEVQTREKAIRYSSRTRLNTDVFKKEQTVRRAVNRLLARLPENILEDGDRELLAQWSSDAAVTIVHLIYRILDYETQSMDYEFSRLSVEEHWAAGESDVARTLSHKDWFMRTKPKYGVTVYDLTREEIERTPRSRR